MGKTTRVEVLANDPASLKHLSPSQMLQHDLQALRQACLQVAAWQKIQPELGVSVNILPSYLERPDFAAQVLEIIASTPLPPQLVTLEIVESQPLRYANKIVQANLVRLSRAKVLIALDDIGSGWAQPLERVRRMMYRLFHRQEPGFRISTFKIDRSLIQQLNHPAGVAVVRGVIALAGTFGVGVVAEGVETDEQMRRAIQLGCHAIQGWRLSHKLTPAECTNWLRQATHPLLRRR